MKELTTLVLMLCFILSGALCYAHGVAGTESMKVLDETPIEIIGMASHSNSERGNAINSSINGHILIVVLSESLGRVAIEITTVSGATVDGLSAETPNGMQFYIPNTGDYIVTFTLPNGDEYYGEFTVTD